MNSPSTIETVTLALLEALKSNDPLLGAQALDCLFDIYTEEDYNHILTKLSILHMLQQGHEYMRVQLPKVKSTLRVEDFNFIKLTLVNLKSFIAYKKKVM